MTGFAGCAVVIPHDRFFLDRIGAHMLAFEGEGRVEWFEGNFEDYEASLLSAVLPINAWPPFMRKTIELPQWG